MIFDRNSRLSDYFTNYHFHVMDVSFSMPTVFSLMAGFRSCTAPEMTSVPKDFHEGTFEYARKVPSKATVNDISFHRGVKYFESDFYDWISGSIKGFENRRKNLLVIHYSDISTDSNPSGSGSGGGLFSFQNITSLVARVPARAWLLMDCIPTVYKSGSDFDATNADISIAELTVSPLYFEEFNI